MIAGRERALPVKRGLLAYSTDAANPILINDLVVIPVRLFLSLLGYNVLCGGACSAR